MLPDVQPGTFNLIPFWELKDFPCIIWLRHGFLYIFAILESTLSVYRIHLCLNVVIGTTLGVNLIISRNTAVCYFQNYEHKGP